VNAVAIARGDLRARLGTRKGRVVQLAFAGAVWLVALLGVAPDREGESPLAPVSVGLLVVVAYLVTASAAGEIAFPGEKAVADLVDSPFSAWQVALGKGLSTAGFALLCTAACWPLLWFVHALRGGSWEGAASQAAVLLAVSWGFGGVATWIAAAVDSEVSRSVLLWGLVVVVLAGAPLVGSWAWHPAHAVLPSADGWARAVCAASFGLLGVVGLWLVQRHVARSRQPR
jgi:hypothetical protein